MNKVLAIMLFVSSVFAGCRTGDLEYYAYTRFSEINHVGSHGEIRGGGVLAEGVLVSDALVPVMEYIESRESKTLLNPDSQAKALVTHYNGAPVYRYSVRERDLFAVILADLLDKPLKLHESESFKKRDKKIDAFLQTIATENELLPPPSQN